MSFPQLQKFSIAAARRFSFVFYIEYSSTRTSLLPSLPEKYDFRNTNPSAQQMSSINKHEENPQITPFETPSNDDFFEKMLSAIPNCCWPNLSSSPKFSWDANLGHHTALKSRDRFCPAVDDPDATSVDCHLDEAALLDSASKLSDHQINGVDSSVPKSFLLQQQLLFSKGVGGGVGAEVFSGGYSGLLALPLSLANGDSVDSRLLDDRSKHGSAEALYNGIPGSLHGNGETFHHRKAGRLPVQNYETPTVTVQIQSHGGASPGGTGTVLQKQRVRARRGQATDPHSIAERLRRERIAERMKALQELVPNTSKTDKASMLDEIIDYVKFLQLQVKVLSMSRMGGAAVEAPLVADISSQVADAGWRRNAAQTAAVGANDNLSVAEHQVAKLMEEDMGSAMQYLQGKGLCLMPISLATAFSTTTTYCNPITDNPHHQSSSNGGTSGGGNNHNNPLLASNRETPASPSLSALTVQSSAVGKGEGGGADAHVNDSTYAPKPC
ncbi:hypothetical protein Nepgr_029139 [Nepenthes gracilis]|uniref:BHLH domain-containing protein n=1 Tax=Nepenthes gracilis TaxID=150966 RepID=A0AAD3TDM2_NEPGR|nr:hypothetical protein Nepgr_029139 [Nepenthes gracilis]